MFVTPLGCFQWFKDTNLKANHNKDLLVKERKGRFSEVVCALEEAKDILEDIQMEEQDAYDALPESLQWSSRGDKMQEYIDLMDDCMGKIDGVIDFVESELMK